MAEPILTVDHLVKSYDGKTNVLDNVSFAVKPGEVILSLIHISEPTRPY